MCIDIIQGQLLYQSLSFIKTQKLCDANTNKCSLFWVLELSVDFFDYSFSPVSNDLDLIRIGRKLKEK